MNKIAAEAKKFTKTHSEIQESVNQLLKYITWIIVIALPLQLWSQYRAIGDQGWQQVVIRSTGGLVGLVPEGLVLLTSVAFLLAAVQLTRQQVLVQELPAVEGLARVDVVCLDKTGTLTVGDIAYEDCEPCADLTHRRVARRWARWPTTPTRTERSRRWRRRSTRRRAGRAGDHRVQLRAEMERGVLRRPRRSDLRRARRAAGRGRPAARAGERTGRDRPAGAAAGPFRRPAGRAGPARGMRSVALVTLTEQVRPDAKDTLEYFAEQGVGIKIISGDNPTTVAAIARRVGLDMPDAVVDARTIGEDPEELREIAERTTVFGRVSPGAEAGAGPGAAARRPRRRDDRRRRQRRAGAQGRRHRRRDGQRRAGHQGGRATGPARRQVLAPAVACWRRAGG